MATNPLERKAKNSFLLGVILTVIIAGAVIAFLVLKIKDYSDKEAQAKANLVKVNVLTSDVKSGQTITSDMFKQQEVDKNTVPSNAFGSDIGSILTNYSLTDKAGNEITTEYKNNEATLYITKNGRKEELKQEDNTGNYYTGDGDNKEYVELTESPLVAKIDLYKNSVVTLEMIAKSDEQTTNDLRKVEYNMLVLPTELTDGDYVDIRLSLPSGQDYIVVSKKSVTVPEVAGAPLSDTIDMNLSEDEIIAMNNAIVEAYKIDGATLRAVTYTEAGVQDKATPTYIPSADVMELINRNPNIVQTARDALVRRYNGDNGDNGSKVRNAVNSAVNNSQSAADGINSKVDESVTNSKENRKKYLDSLSGSSD